MLLPGEDLSFSFFSPLIPSYRRVSIPLTDSNTNASPQRPAPSSHPSDENVAPLSVPRSSIQPITPPRGTPAAQPPTTLGKRARDSTTSELAGALDDSPSAKETPRRSSSRRPSKKVKTTGSDGAESVVSANDSNGHETGSTTSGPSLPAVGTPPPTNHLPEFFSDDIPQITGGEGEQEVGKELAFGSDSFYPFTFGATSSTPRGGETYPFFNEDAFSPSSALKVPADRGGATVFNGQRRISSSVARPQTPARNSGPERFRIDPAAMQQNFAASDMDPFSFQLDDIYGLEYPVRDQVPTPTGATSQSQLQFQFGIGYGSTPGEGGSSPVQPSQNSSQKTMYGTEVANDTRFGDFGRDKIASSGKNMFWGAMY